MKQNYLIETQEDPKEFNQLKATAYLSSSLTFIYFSGDSVPVQHSSLKLYQKA